VDKKTLNAFTFKVFNTIYYSLFIE
jgi:hypothetical protein